MLERLVILGILSTVAFWSYAAFKRWQLARIPKRATREMSAFNRPTLILFTADYCAPCKMQQQPAIERLLNELGEQALKVVRVDVEQDPQTASEWGVLSLPTTYLLDREGNPRQVNHGVASTKKLKQQLEAIA